MGPGRRNAPKIHLASYSSLNCFNPVYFNNWLWWIKQFACYTQFYKSICSNQGGKHG